MNILFLTIDNVADIKKSPQCADLMYKFRDNGHKVYVATVAERRNKEHTSLKMQDGLNILKVWTLNIQKSNILEKGISTLSIENQFYNAVKNVFSKVKFDLILYTTPPITFTKVISFIKARDNAMSYLLLKDIFPQNAVDLRMIKPNSLMYRYFRKKEVNMYRMSDFIGCMSWANVEYLLNHNPELNPEVVEINPNCIEPAKVFLTDNEKREIRSNYGLPLNKSVFIYGGNLGKPQGIDFLLEVLGSNKYNQRAFFVIAGNGTEYKKIEVWMKRNKPDNVVFMPELPNMDFEKLVQCCDVGLIFLDNRFTIPNYPSRLLTYLEYKIPVLAATDKISDIGKDAEKNGYGFWCESGDLESFNEVITRMLNNRSQLSEMGENGYKYLLKNFTAGSSFKTIMKHLK